VISVPWTHLEIEKDVRTGDIAYLLPRPLSYLGTRLAEGLGSLLVRLLALGVTGFAAAWLLAGRLPADPRGLLLAVPLGVVAGAVCTAFHAAIGVTSFWIQDASPLYWIWQKLCFVLGGLVLPLSIYPGWLRTVADWSPFSAMLNGPGRLAMDYDPALAGGTLLRLVAWGLVAALLLRWLYARGLSILDVNGG
jgi:ABC-2 type transport system permease protein